MKLRLPVGLAALALVALSVFLWFASQLYAVASSREVTYRYLSEALVFDTSSDSFVDWREPVRPLVRDFRKPEEKVVGLALTEAWQSFSAALESGDDRSLSDRFSGVALNRARQAVASGQDVHMTVLETRARPSVFHWDGSVLQVDADALTARFVTNGESLEFYDLSTDRVITTLINGSASWKVSLHERIGTEPVETVLTQREIPTLAGINYYPAETPWTLFWPNLDSATLDADFARVAGLGANSVRVFLQRNAFVSEERLAENMPKLRMLLQIAERHGLWVVPTLFDMRGGYQTIYWAEDHHSLKTVLPVLAEASNVAFVDLKNEPDLDFAHHGKGQVEAWARSMLAASRRIAPDLAFTIGWSKADAAELLADQLDVISYHAYADVDGSQDRLDSVLAIAEQKPVHVTEIGSSSFEVVAGLPGSPKGQARALQKRLDGLKGASGIFVWTLHDFPEPDKAAIGSSPWRLSLQSRFGLVDAAGQDKPAADTVRRYFNDFLETQDDRKD